jgi:hypothetical protein
MYKFITVARSDTMSTSMYIYQNEENNKYYISRMFPPKSTFQGIKLLNNTKFYSIEFPQEISDSDISNKKTTYMNILWNFKLN